MTTKTQLTADSVTALGRDLMALFIKHGVEGAEIRLSDDTQYSYCSVGNIAPIGQPVVEGPYMYWVLKSVQQGHLV